MRPSLEAREGALQIVTAAHEYLIWMVFTTLGPVNIYFAPALLHEKDGGKARSAGHSGSMAKLCNTAPAFFVRNPKDGTDFVQPIRYSPLTEADSVARARASC